jgi:hypothetical protein
MMEKLTSTDPETNPFPKGTRVMDKKGKLGAGKVVGNWKHLICVLLDKPYHTQYDGINGICYISWIPYNELQEER